MNVIDVLRDRNIQFRESGRDYLVCCLNDEHDDQHPSMRIDKVTGIFNCFSCGFKGNIFSHFGADPNKTEIEIARLQDKIRDILSNVNLTIPEDAVMFNQDYRGISADTINQFNAFTSNSEDDFKGRLIFPLYDIRGNIKVFMGRSLHSKVDPKYKFFPRHVVPPLFPSHPEVWKNSLIIVEGIFDALNLMDKGCYNVICAFGTTSLFKTYRDKLSHFKILGVNKFYIMFDGDKSGKAASERLEQIMNDNGFNAERIELPDNVDPGDLTAKEVETIMIGLYGNENSSS